MKALNVAELIMRVYHGTSVSASENVRMRIQRKFCTMSYVIIYSNYGQLLPTCSCYG